jgi:Secretion system C-terminal sorting domain
MLYNMKKNLLLLSLVSIATANFGQTPSLPNGNFEQWTSVTADLPQNYTNSSNSTNFFFFGLPLNVTKTTDAYHGVSAVQVTTNASATDTAFGYFINANPDKDPALWTGGVPYNQKPKGIRGYFKYNVATADSGTVIVAFSKAGVNVGTYMIPVGGIHNTYTLFNYTFNPALAVTPDSVVFGALSCKLDNNSQPHGIAGSTLKIDSVSFTGVTSQPALMNGDFEAWQSTTYNLPDTWNLQTSMGEGFSRTTDAKDGTYAIELTTVLGSNNNNVPVARSGYISTGYYPNNCAANCDEQGGFPFTKQKDTLAFYYKYVPKGNDSAIVFLNFKKQGIIIGNAYAFLHSAATYTYKEITFNNGQVPDSVIVEIMSSSWDDTLTSFVGTSLKIDEMHFKSQRLTTSIFSYKNDGEITIFPNPSNGKIQIKGLAADVQSLEIYNLVGEKIAAFTNIKQQIANEIDLTGSAPGIYFVKIYNGEKIYSKKFVIQ